MKRRNPNPDIQLVSTDRLIGELCRRADHFVCAYHKNGIEKTGEGSDIVVHKSEGNFPTLALLNQATGIVLRAIAEAGEAQS